MAEDFTLIRRCEALKLKFSQILGKTLSLEIYIT